MGNVVGPMPNIRTKKLNPVARILQARHCSINVLYERSYVMKMGDIWTPRGMMYFINQPDIVSRILHSDPDLYPKSDLMGATLHQVLGNGIFVSKGQTWRRQRKMMTPAFELARISEVFDLMMDAAKAMKERLDLMADGQEVRIDFEMTHVAADIIFRTIFSEPLTREDAETIFSAFNSYQELAYEHGVWSMAGLPQAFSLARMRAQKYARIIRTMLGRMVHRRFELLAANPENPPRDILASLIEATDDDGVHFTESELTDQIAVLFLAGHETSASTMAWAIYLLGEDREIQKRMREEIDLVFAQEGGFAPRHFKLMKLTRDVFRETLRLYPPVPFVPRDITRDEVIRDKNVRRGSTIFVSPWLLHRHRKHWKNPDVFDPDRFSREDEKESIRTSYMPFSEGSRVCLGASFAMQEGAIILAMMTRYFVIAPVESRVPKPVARLSLRSENGVFVKLLRRQT
ncbi:cytochrome P450 [Rhizobiaceae bacterium n13]|uniref:Cytochrome P450 n=1 Tax=Ferirhizobium litorale TaxID=2927786 RepID=A0AAE3U390_9HYPH|nr:cytochrome P450 [Fererhizobium litorale]MDI7864550.1 cytochrome P450 [Fererhizobium litorale]MDI7924909.1 cytochrome P450 [Fererhizobium litorale]